MAGRRRPPATTPEVLEHHLVSLAYDLAEKQLREGTASPTTINHFLKLGSTLADLEREKLEHENALLSARADSIDSQSRSEEKYNKVLEAIKMYNGQEDYTDYEN